MYKKNEITNKWVHRELYEMHNGKIPYGYHVHHIDKNPTNNSLNNLIAIPEEFHKELHDLDKAGIVLRNKSEVSIALSFYLRGKRRNKADYFVESNIKSKSNVNGYKETKNKKKKPKKIHYGSLFRK